MKKFKIGLFGKVVLAMLAGVALGYILPDVGVRVLKTFNVLFSQFLKFIIPLLIIGLVTPSIADVGKGAGKMLAAVMLVSYASTVASGFFAYWCSGALMPHWIAAGSQVAADAGKTFAPVFELKIPPICDVITALAFAFVAGVGIVVTGAESLKKTFDELGGVIKFAMLRIVIPGLPVYIMTMVCEMAASGRVAALAGTLFKVIGTGWMLTIAYLVLLYAVACAIARRNPFACLWRMAPAYLTAFSICSSAGTIPVTLDCCERNGVSRGIRNFTIPLCANVHMAGSAIKLVASAYAIVLMGGQAVHPEQFAHFILMMGIAAVAAPGVMGGVLIANIGLVEAILGFSPEQTALLMTFYLALDGYGTAANVTGDGAIALAADRFFSVKEKEEGGQQ